LGFVIVEFVVVKGEAGEEVTVVGLVAGDPEAAEKDASNSSDAFEGAGDGKAMNAAVSWAGV
jgi:hypothetical protein